MKFKYKRFFYKNITRNKQNGEINLKKSESFIQILIVLSLIAFSIETLPNVGEFSRRLLSYFEIFCVAVFTVEFFIRLIFSKPKWSYFFSFFGIIDLIAILPFYLAIGLDLRSAKAFRLLRLLRILKLVRYNAAMKRFNQAFLNVKDELILFCSVALILIFISSVGIYYFENEAQPDKFSSVFHSLWWSVATLTTVGYGDIYPITIGGKIFTFFIVLIGVGFIAVPTGIITTSLAEARKSLSDDD